VSPEAAEKHYGVVVALVAGSWSIDHAATVERRARIDRDKQGRDTHG
jgi:hypothetical protein